MDKTIKYYAEDLFIKDGLWDRKRKQKGKAVIDKVIKKKSGILKNYVLPLWGNILPHSLSVKDIDNKLCNLNVSGSTKNCILSCLSEIYIYLIGEEVITYNPVKNVVKFSSRPEKKRGAITPEDMYKLFPQNHDELIKIWGSQVYLTAYLVLRDTGLRPNELRALQWQDWNFDKRFFPITKAIEAGKRSKIKGTKTGSVKPAIVSHFTSQEIERLRFKVNPQPDDFIFICSSGLPISEGRISANFHTGVKRAGLNRPEITPYWFRHTFNTRALEYMEDEDVRKLMGHATSAMTKYYRDADIYSLQREAEKIIPKIQEVHDCITMKYRLVPSTNLN